MLPFCALQGRENPLKHWALAGYKNGTQTGTRTQDQLVKSQLLYQLSYLRFGWIFALQACWRAWRAAKYGSRGCWQDIFLQ